MRPLKLNWTAQAAIVIAGLLVLLLLVTSFERPPIRSTQNGFRGTAMEQQQNPRTARLVVARNQVPEAPPEADTEGDKASAQFQNIQVLGDLSSAQFLRIMVSMTEWVVPQAVRDAGNGCNYCHNPENMASDEIYTKVVARRMLQMTRTVNADWSSHVAQTGVTCYTCHRGQPVPAYHWSMAASDNRAGMVGPTGQNHPAPAINDTSLPGDPFTPFLLNDQPIRVQATTWHPGSDANNVPTTEWTYALMISMSQGLGVNCVFCHNSRAFGNWAQSPPQRLTAWHGIRMVRQLNHDYLQPLTPVFAANRRGPADAPHTLRVGTEGDALKVNCATCHQGVNRPLLGAPMLRDYPELNLVSRAPLRTTEAAPAAGTARN